MGTCMYQMQKWILKSKNEAQISNINAVLKFQIDAVTTK